MIQADATTPIPVVSATPWTLPDPGPAAGLSELATRARHGRPNVPTNVVRQIERFRHQPGPTGAIGLRGVPLGVVADTPADPTGGTGSDRISELALLTVAALLGHPIGYRPEHGGDIVQNIVPTRRGAAEQISTSSKVDLLLHTETAFHPHRPRYLLLLCLRGDPAAGTTLASAVDLVDRLPDDIVDTLFQPRFRTAVDASFLHGRPSPRGDCHPVLSGERACPTLVFDDDLTTGEDDEAAHALRTLASTTLGHHSTVVLEPGDLLLIDNHRAVHGRTAFCPRFDGTDRWLQRAFVVPDLAASAGQRDGLVITTEFTEPVPA